MPRGVKRSEIEIIQADIAAAEKKRDQGLRAAADAKHAITQLQNKIDQQMAKEIAKACRAAGIPLQEVLAFVQARQKENLGAEKAASTEEAAPAKRRPAPKKATAASARGRKPKAAASAKKTAGGRKPRKPAVEKPSPDSNAAPATPESSATDN